MLGPWFSGIENEEVSTGVDFSFEGSGDLGIVGSVSLLSVLGLRTGLVRASGGLVAVIGNPVGEVGVVWGP